MEIIKDNKNQKVIVSLLKKNLVNDVVFIVSEYIRDLVICEILKQFSGTYVTIKNKRFYINDDNFGKSILGFSVPMENNTGCDFF